MKTPLLFILSMIGLAAAGQGFSTISNNWAAPNGGKITGGTFYGYNEPFGYAPDNDNNNSQSWAFIDINGDRYNDLVVTAQVQTNNSTCFSPGLNQYWKVYLSTGTGFATTAIDWNLPNGGRITGGIIYGYDQIEGISNNFFDNSGSQSWSLRDVTGDNKPDLIVTSQIQSNQLTCFSPGANPYWKVYKNLGNGFALTPINWDLPIGGRLVGGVTYGYNNSYNQATNSDNTGSQSWDLFDVNGDGMPDLVVTAQQQAGSVTCFSPGTGQYWKVYLNTGLGFSTVATNWALPNGGKLSGGITYGYDMPYGYAFNSQNTGSQTWSLNDMDGDLKPDLVVTGQLQSGQVTCFSPGSNQYWKVFTNTGSGFSSASSNWNLPNGGKLNSGITYGYNDINGTANQSDNTGSQNWALIDVSGDDRPDLVVTAQLQAGNVTCFSPGSNQYWKVYANAGNGFSITPLNFSLPNGGRINGGVTYGYDQYYGNAQQNDNSGSQSWTISDMNGDKKLDLVVTGQVQGGKATSFSPTSSQYWKVFSSDFVTAIGKHNFAAQSNNLFPNPNNGSFVIKSTKADLVNIVNELGQLVKTVELSTLNNFTAEVSGLETGVYFATGASTQAKIIVLK